MEMQECMLWTVRWWEYSYTHTHTRACIDLNTTIYCILTDEAYWGLRLWASLYHTHTHTLACGSKLFFSPLSATQSRVWSWPGWRSSTLTWKWFMTHLWSQRAKWWTTTHGKSLKTTWKNVTRQWCIFIDILTIYYLFLFLYSRFLVTDFIYIYICMPSML